MHVLLYSKHLACLFEYHAKHNIQIFCLCSSCFVIFAIDIELWLVRVLYILPCILGIRVTQHTSRNEMTIQLVYFVIFSFQINHGSCLTLFVDEEKWGDMSILGHLSIVCTKSWSNMHDTSTIFRGDIITWNHTECTFRHLYKTVLTTL